MTASDIRAKFPGRKVVKKELSCRSCQAPIFLVSTRKGSPRKWQAVTLEGEIHDCRKRREPRKVIRIASPTPDEPGWLDAVLVQGPPSNWRTLIAIPA